MRFRSGYQPNPWADVTPQGGVTNVSHEDVALVGGIGLWFAGIAGLIALACGVLGLFGQVAAAILVGVALLSRS